MNKCNTLKKYTRREIANRSNLTGIDITYDISKGHVSLYFFEILYYVLFQDNLELVVLWSFNVNIEIENAFSKILKLKCFVNN